ncbi:enoyl-CoA hydratase-related protein [Massilia putida]|uniref:enoyl-CoA hydratase-related protein n=1 Tax=Massilia putida TaxID=1141883 RepID=UPI0009511B9E|nr:enoyl-CoA hydratase-related protein [Massilia putida]
MDTIPSVATSRGIGASNDVLHEIRDGVLHILFNRPRQRHALTFDMYLRLAWMFTLAQGDDSVRAVLLSGAGNYFNAGNDLNDFLEFGADDEFVPAHFLRALSRCDKPVVAAVEGGAIGIGATMLLHCDIVYAGASTRFAMPFINLALCPEGASSLLMPRHAGYKQAARWLMLGEPFGAPEAREAGLVTQVVEDGDAMTHAICAVNKLLAMDPEALRQTRRLLRRADTGPVADTIEHECEHFARLLAAPAAQSALAVFAARRR